MRNIFYEVIGVGEGISLYITKNNDIMVEATNENYISPQEIEDAAHAKGFNCCFQTKNKREFAESCHFNNILISKRFYDDETDDSGVIAEFYLSELRKSPAKLKRFLTVDD